MSNNNNNNHGKFQSKGYNYSHHDNPMSEEAFHSVIAIQLQHMYDRMNGLIDELPEVWTDETEGAIDRMNIIEAIESEWIIDDEERAKLSLITPLEDDEDVNEAE